MNYVTEFIDVQKALGIEIKSFSESAFRQADEQNASRITRYDKDGCTMVLVDNKAVVLYADGQSCDCSDDATNKEWLEFFKS